VEAVPENVRRVIAGNAAASAERAKIEKQRTTGKPPADADRTERFTQQDAKVVARRLLDIAQTLEAVHRLSWMAVDWAPRDRESLLFLIQEAARSAARTADVCAERLEKGYAMGLFEDEMELHGR
jgi:hypothetical protein